MDISDLLSPQAVYAGAKASSKTHLLEQLAEWAAPLSGAPTDRIFETVWEREKLSTTGHGRGIAIPHGRIRGLKRMFGLFVKLDEAIDFEGIDGLPVDLVFLLLAPEDAGADHLKALARVSRALRNPSFCERLRAASGPAQLFAVLTAPAGKLVAA
jgi:PTS system nitrogen regulatory IIA component